MTTPTTITPPAIRLILAPIEINAADVLVTVAAESATALLSAGWDVLGDPYDISVSFGDREAAEAILGRKLTREETTALESCIRWHLDNPAGSNPSSTPKDPT